MQEGGYLLVGIDVSLCIKNHALALDDYWNYRHTCAPFCSFICRLIIIIITRTHKHVIICTHRSYHFTSTTHVNRRKRRVMSSVHITHIYACVCFKKLHLEDEQTSFCRKCDENWRSLGNDCTSESDRGKKQKEICLHFHPSRNYVYVFVIFFPPFKAD